MVTCHSIAGAAAKKTVEIIRDGLPQSEVVPFALGIITSAIVGMFAIKILLKYLQSHSTFAFVYYRIALGIVLYWAFFSGIR